MTETFIWVLCFVLIFSGVAFEHMTLFFAGWVIMVIYSIITGILRSTLRSRAEKRLRIYLRTDKIKFTLINKYCELRFLDGNFYCKERTNGKRLGRYFEVRGNSDHAATIWGLLNAEFSPKMKFNDIKRFYRAVSTVNRRTEQLYFDENDMITNHPDVILERVDNYYIESRNIKFPDFLMNEAQNEYCRLTLKRDDEYFYLLCEEIWGSRSFIIECEKPEEELQMFRLLKNKLLNYADLLKYYKYKNGCKVITDLETTYIKQKDIKLKPIDEPLEVLENNQDELQQKTQDENLSQKRNNEREVDL